MAFSLKKTMEREITFNGTMKGRTICIFGSNGTGKSYQCSKFEKPFFIATESGQSALKVPAEPCHDWSKFRQIVNELTSEKTFEESQKLVSTVIIDTADILVDLSEKTVCNRFGVTDLSEIQGRQNGYKIARSEFQLEINKLTSRDYTVCFIMHEEILTMNDEITNEEYDFIIPKGSANPKSSSRFIRDLCDVCIYLKPNGIDKETFEPIPSTAICKQTKSVFARSRFEMPTIITPFTAESLSKAIVEGMEKSAEIQDAKIGSYVKNMDKYTKDDYLLIIKPYVTKLVDVCQNEVRQIIENNLGEGRKISSATDDELTLLDNIYNELVTKATLLGIDV